MAVFSIHGQKSSFVDFFFLYINEHCYFMFSLRCIYTEFLQSPFHIPNIVPTEAEFMNIL